MQHWDDPSKQSGRFIDFIQDQNVVLILAKRFRTELSEKLYYLDWIKV